MYEFVTHTWNTVKGECYHDCSYCYMKRWGKLNPIRFDEKELKTDLGKNNFIFVGSSNDLFAEDVPQEWIDKTINHCKNFRKNDYLFQTKNPMRLGKLLPPQYKACVTLETNRHYPEIMQNSPKPKDRVMAACRMAHELYITIEPIMDFDIDEFVMMLKSCKPKQVNIGADSGNHKLPEPSSEKVLQLIEELKTFTTIHKKRNLGRLTKNAGK
jgi:DNA repair photolyase